jgi:hypothetical protein
MVYFLKEVAAYLKIKPSELTTLAKYLHHGRKIDWAWTFTWDDVMKLEKIIKGGDKHD